MKSLVNDQSTSLRTVKDEPKVADLYQFSTCLDALVEVIKRKNILHKSLQVVDFFPIQTMQQIMPDAKETKKGGLSTRILILTCQLTQPNGQVERISVTHSMSLTKNVGIFTRLFFVSYKNKSYDTEYSLLNAVEFEKNRKYENLFDRMFFSDLLVKKKLFHFLNGEIYTRPNEKMAKKDWILWKKEVMTFFKEKNYQQALIAAEKMLQYTKEFHPDDSERLKKCNNNLTVCREKLQNLNLTETKESTPKPEEKSINFQEITQENFLLWKKELPALYQKKNYKEALIISEKMLQYSKQNHPDKLEWLKTCHRNLAFCHEGLQNFTAAEEAWTRVDQIDQKLTNTIDPRREAHKKIRKLGKKETKRYQEQNSQPKIAGVTETKESTPKPEEKSINFQEITRENFLLWKKELPALYQKKNYKEALIISEKMLQYSKQNHPDKLELLKTCHKNLAICHKGLQNFTAAQEAWTRVNEIDPKMTNMIDPRQEARKKIHQLGKKKKKKSREQGSQTKISGLHGNVFSEGSSASRSSSSASSNSNSSSSSSSSRSSFSPSK